MERVAQMSYEEIWVALNWRLTLPTPETHPDFPLWTIGYTPEQVYDSFFPKDFRFLCNPNRSAICSRFGLNEDRLWRFEFVVLPGEDGQTMASSDKIREVVFPYITHSGAKYGLDVKEICYPESCIEVLRSRPFTFSARSCNFWSRDRVLLCGDAAHVFPPFGGQGIASGFRDSIGLAWRLAMATRNSFEPTDYQQLFKGWCSERKQQLERSLASTVENGSYVTESNRLKIFLRDWYIWAIQVVPAWKHWLELGTRRDGMVKYEWQTDSGMVFLPNLGGGINFPQVYCVSLDDPESTVRFTDDVIFSAEKKGLFQIVIFLDAVDELSSTQKLLDKLPTISNDLVRTSEAVYILRSTQPNSASGLTKEHKIYRLATGEEFGSDRVLCDSRPKPQLYDPYRISREVKDKRYVVLRPDRFVFAAFDHDEDWQQVTHALEAVGS